MEHRVSIYIHNTAKRRDVHEDRGKRGIFSPFISTFELLLKDNRYREPGWDSHRERLTPFLGLYEDMNLANDCSLQIK